MNLVMVPCKPLDWMSIIVTTSSYGSNLRSLGQYTIMDSFFQAIFLMSRDSRVMNLSWPSSHNTSTWSAPASSPSKQHSFGTTSPLSKSGIFEW